jgi:hypothetical protein
VSPTERDHPVETERLQSIRVVRSDDIDAPSEAAVIPQAARVDPSSGRLPLSTSTSRVLPLPEAATMASDETRGTATLGESGASDVSRGAAPATTTTPIGESVGSDGQEEEEEVCEGDVDVQRVQAMCADALAEMARAAQRLTALMGSFKAETVSSQTKKSAAGKAENFEGACREPSGDIRGGFGERSEKLTMSRGALELHLSGVRCHLAAVARALDETRVLTTSEEDERCRSAVSKGEDRKGDVADSTGGLELLLEPLLEKYADKYAEKYAARYAEKFSEQIMCKLQGMVGGDKDTKPTQPQPRSSGPMIVQTTAHPEPRSSGPEIFRTPAYPEPRSSGPVIVRTPAHPDPTSSRPEIFRTPAHLEPTPSGASDSIHSYRQPLPSSKVVQPMMMWDLER